MKFFSGISELRREKAIDFGGTLANHLKSHPFPLEGKVKKAQSKVQKKKSKNSEDRFLVLLLSLEIFSEVGQ